MRGEADFLKEEAGRKGKKPPLLQAAVISARGGRWRQKQVGQRHQLGKTGGLEGVKR